MKLEKMDAFFAARLDGYGGHMMAEIKGAKEFYPYTAALLPLEQDALDQRGNSGVVEETTNVGVSKVRERIQEDKSGTLLW